MEKKKCQWCKAPALKGRTACSVCSVKIMKIRELQRMVIEMKEKEKEKEDIAKMGLVKKETEKPKNVFRPCTDCRYFLSCESGKQFFHRSTETYCEEFVKNEH